MVCDNDCNISPSKIQCNLILAKSNVGFKVIFDDFLKGCANPFQGCYLGLAFWSTFWSTLMNFQWKNLVKYKIMLYNVWLWRCSEVVITRRTRNAFVGLYRHQGSNPCVSVDLWRVEKAKFFYKQIFEHKDREGIAYKWVICSRFFYYEIFEDVFAKSRLKCKVFGLSL